MGINISLSEDLTDFVKEKVATGEYASVEDVVEDALRLMAQRGVADDARLERLKAAWEAGIESGDGGEADFPALRREAHARLMARK